MARLNYRQSFSLFIWFWRKQIGNILDNNCNNLISLCQKLLTTITNTNTLIEIITCLTNWTSVGLSLKMISDHSLFNDIFSFLEVPELFSSTIDLLCELITSGSASSRTTSFKTGLQLHSASADVFIYLCNSSLTLFFKI